MDTTLTLTLGETLRVIRERSGLSQKELGIALEIGRTTVIRWEADKGDPRRRDIDAWLDACGANLAERAAATSAWTEARRASGCISGDQPRLFYVPDTLAA